MGKLVLLDCSSTAYRCDYLGCEASFTHGPYLCRHRPKCLYRDHATLLIRTQVGFDSKVDHQSLATKTEPTSPRLTTSTLTSSSTQSPESPLSSHITPPYSYTSPFGPAKSCVEETISSSQTTGIGGSMQADTHEACHYLCVHK